MWRQMPLVRPAINQDLQLVRDIGLLGNQLILAAPIMDLEVNGIILDWYILTYYRKYSSVWNAVSLCQGLVMSPGLLLTI